MHRENFRDKVIWGTVCDVYNLVLALQWQIHGEDSKYQNKLSKVVTLGKPNEKV
jgi:hypothetical protein